MHLTFETLDHLNDVLATVLDQYVHLLLLDELDDFKIDVIILSLKDYETYYRGEEEPFYY